MFCHEWREIHDGTICAIALSEDLKKSEGNAMELFAASSAKPFVKKYFFRNYVTDGPFLIRTVDGRLHMLWSTYGAKGYVEALAHSDTDNIIGNWCVDQDLLFDSDGGHGMVFQNMEGRYYLALHYPNTYKKEHPCFLPLKYENGLFRSNR